MELKDKVAIVTGSSGGLGQAIALVLAKEGAKLILVDINAKISEAFLKKGYEGLAIKADISQKTDIEGMVSKVVSEYHRIDILVNNAGVCALTSISDITEDEWDKVMGVNLKGTFFCSQAVLKEMIGRKSGKIINIASASAKIGGVAVGAHYSASKAGVICLTKSFALQAAPYKINVNCVCPGPIKTEMTDVWGRELNTRFKNMIPWKEYGTPGDVAEAVLFLASDKARYITGEILDVNGGLVMD
jgi:3-oxoacyl-[acyl-carrier protein] reductase